MDARDEKGGARAETLRRYPPSRSRTLRISAVSTATMPPLLNLWTYLDPSLATIITKTSHTIFANSATESRWNDYAERCESFMPRYESLCSRPSTHIARKLDANSEILSEQTYSLKVATLLKTILCSKEKMYKRSSLWRRWASFYPSKPP